VADGGTRGRAHRGCTRRRLLRRPANGCGGPGACRSAAGEDPARQRATGNGATARAGADDRALRRIAVLAPSSRAADLDAWVWTRGDARLSPFARYLLHAARIRSQLRGYSGGDAVRRLRATADEDARHLLALPRRDPARPADPLAAEDALIEASVRLMELRTGSTGLVNALTGVREARRTVQIARSNLATTMRTGPGAVPRARPGSLFAEDRALAEWFVQRLGDDALYLEAARDRARDVLRIAAAATEAAAAARRESAEARRGSTPSDAPTLAIGRPRQPAVRRQGNAGNRLRNAEAARARSTSRPSTTNRRSVDCQDTPCASLGERARPAFEFLPNEPARG
jgi:hypothetical protein